MSTLINLDPHPIDWTKEDVILLTENGVKRGPKTPSADSVIVTQSWYTAAVSICDMGDYLSIVTYGAGDNGHALGRVSTFKAAVSANQGSYALLRPLRMSTPWSRNSTSLIRADNAAVQIRVYKDGRVAILNREEVGGKTIWYVDTRRKAPFGGLWLKSPTATADEKIAEGFSRQPYLIRVTTDEEVEAAAGRVYMKDASAFKALLPNWLGDLDKKWMPRMTGTSWQSMSLTATQCAMKFFDVLNPSKANIRAQWAKHSGINLDNWVATYNGKNDPPLWMPIDIIYWVACTGNKSIQKAAETRRTNFAARLAEFESEIAALPKDTNLWGRASDGSIMYATRGGGDYTTVTFINSDGKLMVATRASATCPWNLENVPQIRTLTTSADLKPTNATQIVAGQTAASIFAGTVVEQLIQQKATIYIEDRWNKPAQQSTWDAVIKDNSITEMAAVALAAESKPIIKLLRKAGLMNWYSETLYKLNNDSLSSIFFVSDEPDSPYTYRDRWNYDPKATSFEKAVGYPMAFLRKIDEVKTSPDKEYVRPSMIAGLFSKEEYAQLTDGELHAVIQKLLWLKGQNYSEVCEARSQRQTIPDFAERRILLTAENPAQARAIFMARKEMPAERWSPAWVIDGSAPVTFSLTDQTIRSQPADTIVEDIQTWSKCFSLGKWTTKDLALRDDALGLYIEEPTSLLELREELDALRISGTATLLNRMLNADTRTTVYRIRKLSDPNTPYFLVAHDADGKNTVFGYLGCDATKTAQIRCLLQRHQLIYRNPADVYAFLTKHAARL